MKALHNLTKKPSLKSTQSDTASASTLSIAMDTFANISKTAR